jgi:hypothetical protein
VDGLGRVGLVLSEKAVGVECVVGERLVAVVGEAASDMAAANVWVVPRGILRGPEH